MSNRLGIVAWMLVLPLSAWVFVLANAPEERAKFPGDFKIAVQYVPGFSNRKWWRCTITADGAVVKTIGVSKPSQEESQLSKQEVKDLLASVEEVDFFALKKGYHFPAFDTESVVLNITRNHKTHEVTVSGPTLLKKDTEVQRFLRLWTEILRKVPAPDPEQTPESYQP